MRDWDSVNIIRDEGEQREFMSEKIRRILVRRVDICDTMSRKTATISTRLYRSFTKFNTFDWAPWVNSLASVDSLYLPSDKVPEPENRQSAAKLLQLCTTKSAGPSVD
jgi:hypothetical protein